MDKSDATTQMLYESGYMSVNIQYIIRKGKLKLQAWTGCSKRFSVMPFSAPLNHEEPSCILHIQTGFLVLLWSAATSLLWNSIGDSLWGNQNRKGSCLFIALLGFGNYLGSELKKKKVQFCACSITKLSILFVRYKCNIYLLIITHAWNQ